MLPALLRPSLLLACVACAAPGPGPVVLAPAVPQAPSAAPPPPAAPRSLSDLTACAQPWTLEDVEGGAGRVVVVCGDDVRRQDVDPGSMTRAIDPAFAPAQAKLCACAAHLPLPAFIDLVVTSSPEEGRATTAAGDLDEELDAEVARPLMACLGAVKATFARYQAPTCGGGPTTFVYPFRVDLQR